MNVTSAMLAEVPAPIRIDLGCGPNKREGFLGVDRIAFDGVDHVCAIGNEPLPFDDGTVDEVFASHFIEHLDAAERVRLFNELYRVMRVGAQATIVTPHWASNRAYGDPTHKWPPVSEMGYFYVKQEWRDANAPHTDIKHNPDGFACDFDATWGYSLHGELLARNAEFQQFAMTFYKEAASDLHAMLTKR